MSPRKGVPQPRRVVDPTGTHHEKFSVTSDQQSRWRALHAHLGRRFLVDSFVHITRLLSLAFGVERNATADELAELGKLRDQIDARLQEARTVGAGPERVST